MYVGQKEKEIPIKGYLTNREGSLVFIVHTEQNITYEAPAP